MSTEIPRFSLIISCTREAGIRSSRASVEAVRPRGAIYWCIAIIKYLLIIRGVCCFLPVALQLVIIHHFHIICASIFLPKAYAPLHVNGNSELSIPISLQLFQPVAGRDSERIELTCCMQNTQHAQPLSLCCIQRREIARGKKLFRLFIFEAHNQLKRTLMNTSSEQPERSSQHS